MRDGIGRVARTATTSAAGTIDFGRCLTRDLLGYGESVTAAEASVLQVRTAPTGRKVTAVLFATGMLSGATVIAELAGPHDAAYLGLDVCVGILTCAGSPALLRRPARATLAMTALVTLSPVATPPAALGALQVARHHRLPTAVAVNVTGVAAHAVLEAWRPHPGLPYAGWLALIILGYAAVTSWGAWAQTRSALICSLRDRARRAEAEQGRRVAEARLLERRRIAGEMHDVLAHRLSLLATYAGALEYRPDAPPEQLTRAAGVVRASVHQALDDLREVIRLLRDDDSSSASGTGGRGQPALADLPRLIDESRAAGTVVRLRDEVFDPADLPPRASRAAYRVVQEALTNARKHAPGQWVQVALAGRPGSRLVIDIQNPVAKAPGTREHDNTGIGLVGLTERVRLAGGQLDHGIADGRFRLHAWLPWPT